MAYLFLAQSIPFSPCKKHIAAFRLPGEKCVSKRKWRSGCGVSQKHLWRHHFNVVTLNVSTSFICKAVGSRTNSISMELTHSLKSRHFWWQYQCTYIHIRSAPTALKKKKLKVCSVPIHVQWLVNTGTAKATFLRLINGEHCCLSAFFLYQTSLRDLPLSQVLYASWYVTAQWAHFDVTIETQHRQSNSLLNCTESRQTQKSYDQQPERDCMIP